VENDKSFSSCFAAIAFCLLICELYVAASVRFSFVVLKA